MVCKTNAVKKINRGRETVKAIGIATFVASTPDFRGVQQTRDTQSSKVTESLAISRSPTRCADNVLASLDKLCITRCIEQLRGAVVKNPVAMKAEFLTVSQAAFHGDVVVVTPTSHDTERPTKSPRIHPAHTAHTLVSQEKLLTQQIWRVRT